ncbi:MAG: class I SAM-dependent RNA methyltransferase [Gemmataceae bacterium]
MNSTRYFATCARGLEPILSRELANLQAQDISPGRGGVAFAGDRALLYLANLSLRTAVRVLQPILEAEVKSPDELYQAVLTIDWAALMTPDHTLAVDANVRDSAITHSQYAARRVKDAICDQFREKTGVRPSVDTERPMVGLNLHIYKNRATLSLDSSGDSLHKRGYRPALTIAPLNEALAAGLILQTGWHGETAFADPMCGSAALPIEAAWIALHRPPGLTRKHFGFMGWLDYDVGEFAAVRDELRQQVKKQLEHPVIAADERGDVVDFAQKNARTAGVRNVITFDVADIRQWKPPTETGTLIVNPPYGERIGEEDELVPVYQALGELFSKRATGWSCWVFTGNPRLAEAIGLEPKESVPFFNGKIPCRFLKYEKS